MAEGASACDLRKVMDPGGTLFLIDPYPSGRLGVNMQRVIARRAVGRVHGADVSWMRGRSQDLAPLWNGPIDFLFIDGDHSYEGVRRDWDEWTPHVVEQGTVVLHDARETAGGWVGSDDGPARLLAELKRKGSVWAAMEVADSAVALRRS